MRYAIAICAVLALLTGQSLAQEESATVARRVQLEPSLPNDLVRIVKIFVDGVEVAPEVPFQGRDEWFKNLRVVIKNVSAKKIVFAAGQLRFPETGDATAENLAVMARISIGQRPEHVRVPSGEGARNNDPLGVTILLDPGQETAVPVVENFYHVKAMIERKQPLSSVTTCVVGLNTLFFGDGAEWLSGLYFRADPNTPGRYVRISPKEFAVSDQEQSK